MGCKFEEDVTCPKGKNGNYFISPKSNECLIGQTPANVPPLKFSGQYSTQCYAPIGDIEGKNIFGVTLRVRLPDFQPASFWSTGGIESNEMRLTITPKACTGEIPERFKPKLTIAEQWALNVQKNSEYKDPAGNNQFAPVTSLGNGMFFQEHILDTFGGKIPNKSHANGIYFYKDSENRILMFMSCDDQLSCWSEGNVDEEGNYSFSYRMKGVSPAELYNNHLKVKKFVESLYQQE